MNKMKWVAVGLLMMLLFACGSGSVEGIYYNVGNDQEYIQLKNDGQFFLKAGELELSGKYIVEGKSIVLNPDSKMVARGTIEKGLIVDNDGTKWQKK